MTKEFSAKAELFIKGERYDQTVPNARIDEDDERLWQRVRQGVIDDLIREWGGPTIEALDSHGRSVMLTAEEVADKSIKQYYLRGMQKSRQLLFERAKDQDTETIYGSRASDMRGSVRVNGRETYADHNGVVTVDDIHNGSPINIDYPSYGWRPEKVLRRGSKTVPKPVRKVSLREKARAQRRARRKSR